MIVLNYLLRPEVLEGDNKWFNDKDNQYYDANKRTLFWKFPTMY